jgi:hypothetical protein
MAGSPLGLCLPIQQITMAPHPTQVFEECKALPPGEMQE